MHLDGPEPILGMLAAARFIDLAIEPRPDLSLGVECRISSPPPDLERLRQRACGWGVTSPTRCHPIDAHAGTVTDLPVPK
jgi:hypothetical protein